MPIIISVFKPWRGHIPSDLGLPPPQIPRVFLPHRQTKVFKGTSFKNKQGPKPL